MSKGLDRFRFIPVLNWATLLYYAVTSLRYPGGILRNLKAFAIGIGVMFLWAIVAVFVPEHATVLQAIIMCGGIYSITLGMLLPLRADVQQQIILRSQK